MILKGLLIQLNFMIAQPKLKLDEELALEYEELQDDIHQLTSEFKKIGYFRKKELKERLDKFLSKVSEVDYFCILGSIFCLSYEIDNMKKCYQDVIQKYPDVESAQYDYLVALSNANLYYDAVEHGKKMLKKFKNHDNAIKIVSLSLLRLGKVTEAYKFLNKIKDVTDEVDHYVVSTAYSIFKKAKLSDKESENIHVLFHRVLNNKNVLRAVEVGIFDNCVVYRFYLDLSIDEIVELNWNASGVLSELDDMRYNVMMLEFESSKVLEERREIMNKEKEVE
jgi:hypothetical protein